VVPNVRHPRRAERGSRIVPAKKKAAKKAVKKAAKKAVKKSAKKKK
jgi:hypothetical protein